MWEGTPTLANKSYQRFESTFIYDSRKEGHIGKRTGKWFLRNPQRDNYDGFPRFSDYFELNEHDTTTPLAKTPSPYLTPHNPQNDDASIRKPLMFNLDKSFKFNSEIMQHKQKEITQTKSSTHKDKQAKTSFVQDVECLQSPFKTDITPIKYSSSLLHPSSTKSGEEVLQIMQRGDICKQMNFEQDIKDEGFISKLQQIKDSQISFGNMDQRFRKQEWMSPTEQINLNNKTVYYIEYDMLDVENQAQVKKWTNQDNRIEEEDFRKQNNEGQIYGMKKQEEIFQEKQLNYHINDNWSSNFTPEFQPSNNFYYSLFLKHYSFYTLIGTSCSYEARLSINFCTAQITASIQLPTKKSLECRGLGSKIDLPRNINDDHYHLQIWRISKSKTVTIQRNGVSEILERDAIYILREYQPFCINNYGSSLAPINIMICLSPPSSNNS